MEPGPAKEAAEVIKPEKAKKKIQIEEVDSANNYLRKVRKRFKQSPETYQQFLNIPQNYQEEQKTLKEVYAQVQGLFEGHNDLLTEFARFLPDPDAPQPQYQARQNKPARAISQRKPVRRGSKDDMMVGRDKPRFMTGPGYKDEMEFFKQFKSRMPLQQWENFLKLLNMFNNRMVTATELKVLMRELFQKPQRIYNQNAKRRANDQDPGSDSPDLYEGLLKFLGMLCCGNASIFDGKKVAPKELHRAPHDRDGGPSYMCRASNTLAVCTGRNNPEWTEVCDAVLNDQYSLNPLGTEQSAVLTNTHEMALFRAEDERYELDTMVGRTSMAVAQIESIADELATLSRVEKQRFDIYDKIGLLPMRTIHKIYGDHGNDMVDLLYEHPAATIPIVLARLKQKDEEYRLVRHQQNRLWQEVFEQNYHKALDHRSYAFKVQDKKALHTKSILLALREVPEGISITYGVPSRDIQLWHVLKEIIKDLVDAEEASIMTSWWEDWFCPFLGSEITAPEFGTPGREPEKTKKSLGKNGGKKILYANHTMATMLRLHQMLHSRMLEAKEMAEDDMNETGPSRENQLLDPETPRYNDELQVSPTLAQSGNKRRNKDHFETFITNLLAMLRQTMDINKYEDECRTLLGTSSYKVFTLDKLIPRLIKETNNLATSESWRKIKAAHDQFNGTVVDGVKPEPLSLAEYRWRMCEEFSHNCFEVVYDPVTHMMNISNVAIDEAEETEKMRRERAQLELEQRAVQDEDAEGEEGAEGLNALLQVKTESRDDDDDDEGDAGIDDEAEGGIDMDVEDEERPSQEPLIRRPALGYGNNADESEDESDA